MTEEYGHHAPDYDPRGPDFDAAHTPEREAHMLARKVRETQPDLPCPVCGEVHTKDSKPHE